MSYETTGRRVRDHDVERFLIWARNYREIDSFKLLRGQGPRKWLIKLLEQGPTTASGMEPGWLEQSVVPQEMVLTGREALVFGYGLAIAGSRPESRREFAKREWDW